MSHIFSSTEIYPRAHVFFRNLNQYGIQSNDTLEKDGDHHEVQI